MKPQIDCLFCSIVSRQIQSSVVFEDAEFIAILTIRPWHMGHTLLFPKEHVEDFADLGPKIIGRVFNVAAKIKKAISDEVNCTGFQLLINEGPATGQKPHCRHLHIHLVPRSAGDLMDLSRRTEEVQREILETTAKKILLKIKEGEKQNV